MDRGEYTRRTLLGVAATIGGTAFAAGTLASERDTVPGPEIVEPELPIIDAHHHLWPVDSWRQYSVADFAHDIRTGHNVRATVFAECRANYDWTTPDAAMIPVGEVEYLIADSPTRPPGSANPPYVAAGIVGWADLRSAPRDVARTLEAELAAGEGRFRGVRHNAVWHPNEDIVGPRQFPPHLLLDKGFRAGLQEVAARGLSYDVWMFSHQLPDIADLAGEFPHLTIILDHLGGPVSPIARPEARAAVFALWRKNLKQVAALPNVMLKLGGIGMPAFGFGFSHRQPRPGIPEAAELWRPYFETAIETFGVQRCMFESNFPVDRASLDYRSIWNVYKTITKGYSASEKQALYHDNAARIYRLTL